MSAIAQQRSQLQTASLGLIAAVSAIAVTIVIHDGTAASGYALFWVALLALAAFSALVCTRPLVTFTVALIFMTSPFPLLLSLPQSALISGLLLGGATVGFVLRTPLRSMAPDPLLFPMAIFATYGVLSAVYGLWLGNELGYVLGDCFQVIEFSVAYFLVSQLLNDRGKGHIVLRWLLISILITILLELSLFVLGSTAGDILPSWEGSSVSEVLVRTIDIDATILFAMLVNLYPAATSSQQRFWICVALIATVANIVLSLSRGIWLCTLIAASVSMALQARNMRKRLLAASVLAGICVVLFATAWKIGPESDGNLMSVIEERLFRGVDQVESGLAGRESMATRRFLEATIVWPQVLAKPWIGHGLGATYVIGGFGVLDSGTNAQIDHHFIHNLYLVTAFRMGFIGLGLLLWMLFRYFRTILRASAKMPVDVNRALVIGLIASIVGQLFLSFTQPTVIDHPTCALIACAMAFSCRLAKSPASSESMALQGSA